jgi:hypothetical protein
MKYYYFIGLTYLRWKEGEIPERIFTNQKSELDHKLETFEDVGRLEDEMSIRENLPGSPYQFGSFKILSFQLLPP